MERFTTIAQQRIWSESRCREGKRIAYVPTMGALHEGHLSLVRRARSEGDLVVASIFVNPLQFDRPEDLAKYPLSIDEDLALLAKAGVDAVFLPTKEELYPNGFATFIEVVGPLTDKLCAATRPGHFRGVTTVVAKLFHIVQPEVAVFGEKDLQQVLIVARMVSDLAMPVRIVVGETVRDPDGLAMSSRNRRLTPAQRQVALALPRGLEKANRLYKEGTRQSLKLIELVAEELLMHENTELDYADVIDLHGFVETESAEGNCVLAAAAFVGDIRLIDHVHLGGKSIPVAIED